MAVRHSHPTNHPAAIRFAAPAFTEAPAEPAAPVSATTAPTRARSATRSVGPARSSAPAAARTSAGESAAPARTRSHGAGSAARSSATRSANPSAAPTRTRSSAAKSTAPAAGARGRSSAADKQVAPTAASTRTRSTAAKGRTAESAPTRSSATEPTRVAAERTAPAPLPATGEPPTFLDLGVPPVLAAALAAEGVTTAFPIQAATLPDSLAGRDVLGRGRTGSGKTYAFALPVLARLAAQGGPSAPGRPRALVLAPTRELATQIHASLAPLARALSLRVSTVFGGVPVNAQVRALRAGVDVLVACPGRLTDLLDRGAVHLGGVEVTVLDEADHMADLGFLPAVRRLLDRTPADGQRLLFSATLDGGVDVLVRAYLTDPVTHSVDPVGSPVSAMEHHVLHVRPESRLPVLVDLTAAPGRSVVFTRTKRGATRLARQLVASGVPAVELHGNLAQNARTRNLAAFAGGGVTTLVATDIAARGIHVDEVALVIHADPPVEHKAYLHRSGRTARAGARGTVVTLVTDDQVAEVRDLTRKAGVRPTTTRLAVGDPLLSEIAPGERSFLAPPEHAAPSVDRSAARPRRGTGRPARTERAAAVPSRRASSAASFSAGSRSGRRGR